MKCSKRCVTLHTALTTIEVAADGTNTIRDGDGKESYRKLSSTKL